MLTVVSQRRGSRGYPLRQVNSLTEDAPRTPARLFEQRYLERTTLDPPGVAAEGDAADGTVHGAQRADAEVERSEPFLESAAGA
jgi:hypothetical protein